MEMEINMLYQVKFGLQLEKQDIIDVLRIVVDIDEDIRTVWLKDNQLTKKTFASISKQLDILTEKGVLHPDINRIYRMYLEGLILREDKESEQRDIQDWVNALRTQIMNTLAK